MTFYDYENQKEISGSLKRDIDKYCESKQSKGFRKHLGGSIIGNECLRALWYGFRWAKQVKHEGRLLRLFNRGHREEEVIIDYLRGIGCDVQEFDENTGKQFRVSACNGHFGGSLDSKIKLPSIYNIGDKMVLEMKTVNHKYFTPLFKKSVKEVFLDYYSQMCIYGKLTGLKYGLFVAVDKQDDELYIEIVELDYDHAEELLNKAAEVIHAESPPPKIASRSSFYKCKMCNYSNICWGVADPETTIKNCRCCNRAEPVENGQWFCVKYNGIIPEEFILTACGSYRNITYTL